MKDLERGEQHLKGLYAGDDNRFKKHEYDQNRAMQAEHQALAESLLNMVEGSLGRQVEDNEDKDPVLFAVG